MPPDWSQDNRAGCCHGDQGLSGRFHWHAASRVVGVDGATHLAGQLPQRVIADRPAVAALQAALAQGAGFRIGAGPVPASEFETLTGGSTGAPRRISRDCASWQASFAVNAQLFGIGPGVPVAVLGRLVHSLALYGALEALHLGAMLHVLDGQRPDRQRAALAARDVEVIYATPAQLRLMVECGGALLPALRFILVGGSKLDPGLRAGLAAMCPTAAVREFYGAAETSFITLADAQTPEGAVGKAYPGVEIDLRDARDGVGKVWVRSPYLARGYAGDDPGDALWRDGWVTVHEYARMEGGNLYLMGRANRMVTVADQNVFPEEIEGFLMGLPGVQCAAVVARHDDLRGALLWVVLLGDMAKAGDVLAMLRAQFGPLKAPRRAIWRNDWPVLPSGKTDLRRIEGDLT